MLLAALDSLPKLLAHSPRLGVLTNSWVICTALITAICLIRWCYTGSPQNHSGDKSRQVQSASESRPPYYISLWFNFENIFGSFRRRRRNSEFGDAAASPPHDMCYLHGVNIAKKVTRSINPPPETRQPYEAFLILDVEATCQLGSNFNYPNEIIEFPVCLMRWKNRSKDGTASNLELVDEFRSFAKPTWKPNLSEFCRDLTGITQAQVDSAPLFSEVIDAFHEFMARHKLIDARTGKRLARFCWCSDGPFDVRDFVVKQCFISKVPMPEWIRGDVIDVRTILMDYLRPEAGLVVRHTGIRAWNVPMRRSLNISAQLNALGLPSFEGRQHSGIDDARNIAKIVAELARRGICLRPNTPIRPNKRWRWMGKAGRVLDEY